MLIGSDPEMEWVGAPTGRRGRPDVLGDAAIQTCLTLKALLGWALRRRAGRVASLLKLAGRGICRFPISARHAGARKA